LGAPPKTSAWEEREKSDRFQRTFPTFRVQSMGNGKPSRLRITGLGVKAVLNKWNCQKRPVVE